MKSAVQLLLRFYKRWISPALPQACRFTPTCSEYAQEAVERLGVVRGGLKTLWRVVRCNPLSRGGYDPVIGSESGAGHSCGQHQHIA